MGDPLVLLDKIGGAQDFGNSGDARFYLEHTIFNQGHHPFLDGLPANLYVPARFSICILMLSLMGKTSKSAVLSRYPVWPQSSQPAP